MRYQIADGIIDYIHLCWLTFLLAPLGTFAMGTATIFGPLRREGLHLWLAALMIVLALAPILCIGRGCWWGYALARLGSAGWYGYLAYLCVVARPLSTGAIYGVVSVAAVLLARSAWRQHRGRSVST